MSIAQISSLTTPITCKSHFPSTSKPTLSLRPNYASSLSSSFLHVLTLKTTSLRPHHRHSSLLPPIKMSMEAGVGIMGTKLGMMSCFEPTGKVIPVTVVGFKEGNIVTQIKTKETDGYDAVQVGYRRVRDRKLTKPEMGHLEKSGIIPLRHLQEFRLVSVDGFETNQKLAVEDLFKEGDLVDVAGTTIGKGFQGQFPSLFPSLPHTQTQPQPQPRIHTLCV